MTYIFLFYVFLSIVCITGGSYYFYSSNQQLTAYLYFIGSIVAVIFFGFRWFSPSGDPVKNSAGKAWPPSINYCPDFLSLATIDGEQVCIDTIGVGQAGALSVSDGTQVDDRYLFHLFLNQTGSERVKLLCEQAGSKQVTWEGVWDGSLCMGAEPPKPPKA